MKNLEVSLRDLGIILAFGSGTGGGALVSGPSNRTTTNNAVATWNGTTGNSLNDNPNLQFVNSTSTLSILGNAVINAPTGPFKLQQGGSTAQVIVGSITIFGGTTTNNSNGVIQLQSATTSAGGIGFGSDTALYRRAAGTLDIDSTTGGALELNLNGARVGLMSADSSTQFTIGATAASGVLFLKSNNSTTITLDASNNSTFTGQAIFAASTTTKSGISMTTGTAPTSPADGNFWYDGTNLKFRNGATSRTITWV